MRWAAGSGQSAAGAGGGSRADRAAVPGALPGLDGQALPRTGGRAARSGLRLHVDQERALQPRGGDAGTQALGPPQGPAAQSRLRGMLVHQDGSRHAWLAGRPPLDLIRHAGRCDQRDPVGLSGRGGGHAVDLPRPGRGDRAARAVLRALHRPGQPRLPHAEGREKVDPHRLTQVGRALRQLGIRHIRPTARSAGPLGAAVRHVAGPAGEGAGGCGDHRDRRPPTAFWRRSTSRATTPASRSTRKSPRAPSPYAGTAIRRRSLLARRIRVVGRDNTVRGGFDGRVAQLPPDRRATIWCAQTDSGPPLCRRPNGPSRTPGNSHHTTPTASSCPWPKPPNPRRTPTAAPAFWRAGRPPKVSKPGTERTNDCYEHRTSPRATGQDSAPVPRHRCRADRPLTRQGTGSHPGGGAARRARARRTRRGRVKQKAAERVPGRRPLDLPPPADGVFAMPTAGGKPPLVKGGCQAGTVDHGGDPLLVGPRPTGECRRSNPRGVRPHCLGCADGGRYGYKPGVTGAGAARCRIRWSFRTGGGPRNTGSPAPRRLHREHRRPPARRPDFRGDGGYIIAPHRSIHPVGDTPSGRRPPRRRRGRWRRCPTGLLALLRPPETPAATGGSREDTSSWLGLLENGSRGRRNARSPRSPGCCSAAATATLPSSPPSSHCVNEARCRPPLPGGGR